MPYLITIDPGVHEYGKAVFGVTNTLEGAFLCRTGDGPVPYYENARMVSEKPQVYDKGVKRGGRMVKVRSQDQVDLALYAGRITANYPCTYRLPTQWKHQVPKEIQHARMWKVLTPCEVAILRAALLRVPKGKQHNVSDAVCIGLVELGRMGLGGGL